MATKKHATKSKNLAVLPPPEVDLLYQALETEMGGVEIYTMALECVQNEHLREEWEEYLEHAEAEREEDPEEILSQDRVDRVPLIVPEAADPPHSTKGRLASGA